MEGKYKNVRSLRLMMIEWNLNRLLFADDTVLAVDSKDRLCQLVEKIENE